MSNNSTATQPTNINPVVFDYGGKRSMSESGLAAQIAQYRIPDDYVPVTHGFPEDCTGEYLKQFTFEAFKHPNRKVCRCVYPMCNSNLIKK
jgi:hypothetical protein